MVDALFARAMDEGIHCPETFVRANAIELADSEYNAYELVNMVAKAAVGAVHSETEVSMVQVIHDQRLWPDKRKGRL